MNSKGFTLIEIMIALAILVIIMTLGLFISFDFYKSYAFHAEKNIIISVLQKARNQSLSNINQVRHGVHFQVSPLEYIIYECPSNTLPCNYATPSSTDNVVKSSYGISITHPLPLPFDVVFDQLSGSCIVSGTFDCTSNNPITISYGAKSYNITVNSEGQIDW